MTVFRFVVCVLVWNAVLDATQTTYWSWRAWLYYFAIMLSVEYARRGER